jgi:glutathione S-transferase
MSTKESSVVSSTLYNFVDPNKVHLFVKAGQDSRSQGACPFCQDVFMQLLVKADDNKFNFDVITINMDNPPKEFKELSIKPPVLFHNMGEDNDSAANVAILSDVDEIAEHLDKLFPNKQLSVISQSAKNSFLNVFSKFSHFIRDVSSQASLEIELERINNYLGKCQEDGKKFLCGDYLTKLDCSLLPRLQHIRVASEGIKRYKIPERFTNLWRYLDNAYKTEAFQKSCPSDREIIWHWSKTHANTKDFLLVLQETPYKTLQIPNNVEF